MFHTLQLRTFTFRSTDENMYRVGWSSSTTLYLHLEGTWSRSQPGHSYPDWDFSWFPSVPSEKCWDSISNWTWSLPSRSFPIHQSSHHLMLHGQHHNITSKKTHGKPFVPFHQPHRNFNITNFILHSQCHNPVAPVLLPSTESHVLHSQTQVTIS
jgi:hypothetical protein